MKARVYHEKRAPAEVPHHILAAFPSYPGAPFIDQREPK